MSTKQTAVCKSCGTRSELEELTWVESSAEFVEEAQCPDCAYNQFNISQ